MMHRLLIICLMLFAMIPLRAASDKAKPVISILGDSYSTFEGYIPSGNPVGMPRLLGKNVRMWLMFARHGGGN